jgi:hypothetical protein
LLIWSFRWRRRTMTGVVRPFGKANDLTKIGLTHRTPAGKSGACAPRDIREVAQSSWRRAPQQENREYGSSILRVHQ